MAWTVSAENQTDAPVTIAESAILRRIPQLQPFDHASMSILTTDAAQNGLWARAGRAGEDVTKLAAFLAAAKNIRIGDTALVGLTATLALSPYIIQRLRGAAVPVTANFERLAWLAPLALGPGESASMLIFTAVWASPQPIAFSLDTSHAPLRRALQ